jgi:hypothetical protein
MNFKKLSIGVVAISLTLAAGALIFTNLSGPPSTKEIKELVATDPPKEIANPKEVVIKPLEKAVAHGHASIPPLPEPSAQDIKLQALQDEIKTLSDSEIRDQASNIKARIHESNLIYRLNGNLVSDEEREDANQMLTRLALLGVEKAKRGLDAIKPELEQALKKTDNNQ